MSGKSITFGTARTAAHVWVFGRVSCPNQVNEGYQDRQSYLPVAVPVAAGCIGQFKGLSRSYPTRLPLGEVGKSGDN